MTLVTRPNDPAAGGAAPLPSRGCNCSHRFPVQSRWTRRTNHILPGCHSTRHQATEPEATVAAEPFLGMVGFRGNSGAVLLRASSWLRRYPRHKKSDVPEREEEREGWAGASLFAG
jgi:hypothetical protein